MGSDIPVFPRKMLTYLTSIILGVALPSLFLFAKFSLDTKIHTKEQLAKLLI